MKRMLLIIVFLVYLVSSTGATVHFHYCMGKLADWGLQHHESSTCNYCGMKKASEQKDSCCKDEHKFIKNDTDQKIAVTEFDWIKIAAQAFPTANIELPLLPPASSTAEAPTGNGPPPGTAVAIYIFTRTFLI